MANFYATARSNYFRVKDYDAFEKALEPVGIEIVRKDDMVMVHPDYANDSGWPSCYYDDETYEEVSFDIVDVIQKHIAEGECAVLIQVGNEKLRYLDGFSMAITSDEIVSINLVNIYEQAELLVGKKVSRAEY